ncbi:long-chain-fatty-acid--CoA ligase 1-like isoform X2 [Engraulis encrasicolus]
MELPEFLRRARLPDMAEVRDYLNSLSSNTLMGMGAFTALSMLWYARRPRALDPPCDLWQQSVEIEGGEYARRSVLMEGGKLLTYYYEDSKTLYEFLLRGVRMSNNGPCLGGRKPKQPYEFWSYSEVVEMAECFGSALLHRGHSKSKNPYIGIFSQNRPEWTMSEMACYTYSLVSVPLYDTLGTEAIEYIIDKASIATVLCDVPAKVTLLLDSLSGRKHTVTTIIAMEEVGQELVAMGKQNNIDIITFKDALAVGKANRKPPMPPLPDDLAVICFTSGTTGNPKGAMLTHKNVVSDCSAFMKIIEKNCPISNTDVHISYLPLAHMFERVVQGVMLAHGASIGFFQGDIRLLMDDLAALKPTVFPVVPRLLNRMYDRIHSQASGAIKKWLLGFASRRKEAEMNSGIMRRDSIWDKLIFKKVQANLGGRVRLMLTGAAPVSATVLTFLRGALGCQFYEGYGQTECTAGCTITLPGDWTAGHVGAPLPCNFIKLVDVSEMNYLAANGEGEVCVKGPNVFLGYLEDPDKTAEALDGDGWLHTGDIGKWLPNGTLKIVDRKKHIFKLAQGEYIAPEKIENVYIRSDAVAQAFVHGDSLQACLVAIIVPDPEVLPKWAKSRGINGSYDELCKNQDVKKAILEDILKLGKDGGLKSFEQVKDIALHNEMFSVENGLLTPTFKAKRADLKNHFREQIDELYSHIKM